jgi:GntR family transcriptional regulator
MNSINRDSPIPAYYQIALAIRNRILQQEWEIGQRIPSETELAKLYGVSRVTMRQAIAELVKDGVLERKRGSGTFINQKPIPLVHDLSLPHILAGRLRKMGLATSSRIIKAQTFPDPLPEVQQNLKITEKTPVAYLKRILLIGDEPTALNRSWFDNTHCPDIAEQELIDNSLSKTLRERYGLVPAYANNWLEVIRSTQETAELLDNRLDMPMILVRSVSYLADETPLEYSITEWLGDRIRFNFQTTFVQESTNHILDNGINLNEDCIVVSSLS